MNFTLSKDQEEALSKINKWLETDKRFFILQGFAGTGKSFLMDLIAKRDIPNMFFTATTNKACKVLEGHINLPVKTIYSLLGLKMVEKEDKLVLSFPNPNKKPHFPKGSIIVIDEASMVGLELLKLIYKLPDVRVIFVGDPAQLPPVGEPMSGAWKMTDDSSCRSMLRTVMRNDNELLNLATKIRACLREQNYTSPVMEDIGENGDGVYLWDSQQEFEAVLLGDIKNVDFSETKVIAWRNKTVDYYNNMIRKHLGFKEDFEVNDILLLGKPVEREGVFIAHTDDEFVVKEAIKDNVVIFDNIHRVEYWELFVTGTQEIALKIPKDQEYLNSILAKKANIANNATAANKKRAWEDFWRLKNYFDEVRYGYALTAHRAQGSTLTECYIDQQDIISNYKCQEAFQCLYVAATRATKQIHTF